MMKRRQFLKDLASSSCALSVGSLVTRCLGAQDQADGGETTDVKISLAQWSLHRGFHKGALDPRDFARIAITTYGLGAVEYVNGFYPNLGADVSFWAGMRKRADDVGVQSLLMMVDDEGDLGVADERARRRAIENHYKWIHAAKVLGCHSVRVNAFGERDRTAFRSAIVDSMGTLSDYAAKENINVIIENHGLFSSDGKLISGIVKEVDRPNCGTLPDFGNWCLGAKWGSTQHECRDVYDRYQGVREFMPFAKAVSAKSYHFDDRGDETKIDYFKMIKIVKDAGYRGYIGIEYEGQSLSEHKGILATKALIEKAWRKAKRSDAAL